MGGRSKANLACAAGLLVIAAGCGGSPASAPPASAQPATAAPTAVPPTAAPVTAAPTQAGTEPTADPFAFVAQFEGTYSGTWKNTTFGSTGPASIEFMLDRGAGALGFTITLGGNVFGSPEPAPEQLSATIVPGQGLSFESKTFGPTTVSVDFTGGDPVVTVSSPDVPSARIKTFTATATITDPKTIDFAYDVEFRDSTPAAHGTAKLTRP